MPPAQRPKGSPKVSTGRPKTTPSRSPQVKPPAGYRNAWESSTLSKPEEKLKLDSGWTPRLVKGRGHAEYHDYWRHQGSTMTDSEHQQLVYVSDVPMLVPWEARAKNQQERNIVYGMFVKKNRDVKAQRRRHMAELRRLYGLAASQNGWTASPSQRDSSSGEAPCEPQKATSSSGRPAQIITESMGLSRTGLGSPWSERESQLSSPTGFQDVEEYMRSLEELREEYGLNEVQSDKPPELIIPNVPHGRRELLASREGATLWRLQGMPQHAVGRNDNITALHPSLVPRGVEAMAWRFSDAAEVLGVAPPRGSAPRGSPAKGDRGLSLPKATSLPWDLFSPMSTMSTLPSPSPPSTYAGVSRLPSPTTLGTDGHDVSGGTFKPHESVDGSTSLSSLIGDDANVDELLEWSKGLSWQDYCDNVLAD